jgi:hypothetical protein
MQNTLRRVVGRRAVIKGTAMLAASATVRAQGQPSPTAQGTTLADVPLGPSVTVTVERRGDARLFRIGSIRRRGCGWPRPTINTSTTRRSVRSSSSATARTSRAASTSTPRRRQSFQGNAR